MNTTAIDIDPRDVALPGRFSPSVAHASADQLREELEKSLEAAADLAKPEPVTADGLVPQAYMDGLNPRADGPNLSACERTNRRILAIRAELQRREEAREEEARSMREEVRARLQGILDAAPGQAAELQALAEKLAPAVRLVNELAEAVALVGGAGNVGSQFHALREAAGAAAVALGREPPEMPDPPEGLRLSGEATRLLTALSLGRGYDRVGVSLGDAHKARELVRKLEG